MSHSRILQAPPTMRAARAQRLLNSHSSRRQSWIACYWSDPTMVIEVGFSQKWKSLMEDAWLFLTGTGGINTLVVLVKLDEVPKLQQDIANIELPSQKDMKVGIPAEQVPASPALLTMEQRWDSGFVARRTAELHRWYSACEARGQLRIPLVGRLSGRLAHVRRWQKP
ncbi:hypothetical protein DFH27DRAFT_581993 [Peziza echinospora]|nr:hypothetical protein DFH27DRAFT_581993 [Peziza echinospora]